MLCLKKSSKRGFTLLETMLSVALLLIVTLIAYEGFMTTLNYAGDTALADRVSNKNAGSIYEEIGKKTAYESISGGASTTAIMIEGTGYKNAIQVHPIHKNTGMSVFSAGSSLTDDSNFSHTTNRSGFYYEARQCKTHKKNFKYYDVTKADGTHYVEGRCPVNGCTEKATFY